MVCFGIGQTDKNLNQIPAVCLIWREEMADCADIFMDMEQAKDTREHSNSTDFRHIKQRFIQINQRRLRLIEQDLRPRQQEFLTLLPLLFHVNHPLLPGYVSAATPTGVPDYSPTQASLKAAKRVAKSFEFKKRAYRTYEVVSIFLMGSTGTIAYSDKSDFDIWVCHAPNLENQRLDELEQKARGIEAWAKELGVEANIFLVDPERFKAGQHSRLSRESSGSALHFLLLDEFYRTSVLLAGRIPLWWLVPPEKEHQYEEYVTELKKKRFVYSRDHVDLGGLALVPAEEFYGATLWLLYKGIDSPYKSVLKILLMEVYASEFPSIELLATQFKKSVYEDRVEITDIDPYLMMLSRVENYLAEREEPERIELARRCFYFKVNEQLSDEQPEEKSSWRRQAISELVSQWKWHPSNIFMLDRKGEWKLNRVRKERQALIGELTSCYRFLSEFARTNAGALSLIKPADLNVLGRKLYATFERKAGKIEILYQGITENLYEERITIHRLLGEDGKEAWAAFEGLVKEKEIKYQEAIRRSHSIIELLAWCFFNRIVGRNTLIALYAEGSDLSEKETRLIIEQLERNFPQSQDRTAETEDYRQPVRIREVTTFINVGLDPFSVHSRKGRHLTSNQTDALKYGGLLENLALSIDQLLISTWQETLTTRYRGVSGLMDCLRDYINWAPPSQGRRPPPINAVSFSSLRSNAIARRVEEVFDDIMNVFYDVSRPRNTHYVLGAEHHYYALHMRKDNFIYSKLDDKEALFEFLSGSQESYRSVVFDRETLAKDVLPILYSQNRPNRLQYFYVVRADFIEVFIIDEKGALFHQELYVSDYICLITHFQRLFDSLKQRMRYRAQDLGLEMANIELEVYRVEKNYNGDWVAEKNALPKVIGKKSNFAELQVIVDMKDGKEALTIYYMDREFSSLEYGDSLYVEVARHLLAERSGHDYYPIYVTDIDLSSSIINENGRFVQTCQYLQYKKRIEDALNRSLRRVK